MDHPKQIIVTAENVHIWPKFNALKEAGKIISDTQGRMRYLHGAPVGVLILSRLDSNGNPIYRESAEEWFDPDSQMAAKFEWPK